MTSSSHSASASGVPWRWGTCPSAAPAEVSIGLNKNVVPTGSMRTDKKMYATSHIGLGDTVVLGGTCHAKLRLEGVIRYPEISVDGQTLTRGGRILLDD